MNDEDKVLNQTELESLTAWVFDQLIDSQLQDVFSFSEGLILTFYKFKTYSLVFDLNMNRPWLFLSVDSLAHLKKKTPWPIQLFLNSHGENLRLTEMTVESVYGRVVSFKLKNSTKELKLQFILIPKQVNLLASTEDKKIAFHKPKSLTQQVDSNLDKNYHEVRGISILQQHWQQRHFAQKKSGQFENSQLTLDSDAKKKNIQRHIEKKIKAKESLEQQIIKLNDNQLLEKLGYKLKTYGLKQEFSEAELLLLDLKTNLAKNMENVYFQIKHNKKKLIGTVERIKILTEEISKLQTELEGPNLGIGLNKKNDLNSNSEKVKSVFKSVKTRKLSIESGVDFYVGKSAVDNLSLLRQSRSWDVWFHFKDFPGAYGVIRLDKGKKINSQTIKQCCEFLIKESLGHQDCGYKIAVVYTECRFVRPIKGDKIGRVTYAKAQEVSIDLK